MHETDTRLLPFLVHVFYHILFGLFFFFHDLMIWCHFFPLTHLLYYSDKPPPSTFASPCLYESNFLSLWHKHTGSQDTVEWRCHLPLILISNLATSTFILFLTVKQTTTGQNILKNLIWLNLSCTNPQMVTLILCIFIFRDLILSN